MDHLPRPHRPRNRLIEVPYFCEEDYDRGIFLDYPDRAGWSMVNLQDYFDRETLIDPHFGLERRQTVSSFFQNWLFIGLLWEVFGESFSAANFVRIGNDGQKYISTANLLDLGHGWIRNQRENEARLAQHIILIRKQHFYHCLSTAYHLLSALSQFPGFDHLDWRLTLSLALLGEFLSGVVHYAFSDRNSHFETLHIDWKGILIGRTSDMLRSQRLCPKEVSHLWARLPLSQIVYINDMSLPEPTISHEECSEKECLRSKVDLTSYKTLHRNTGCSCDMAHPEQGRLHAIVAAGSIPLISVSSRQGFQNRRVVEVELVSWEEGLDYVAISHVWSQGLGNTLDNSLPSCQLSYINTAVNRSRTPNAPPLLFWIDTMCCPRGDKRLRNSAIAQMRHVYTSACSVLVLDSSLENTVSAELLTLELSMRIIVSPWLTRLWTYQEACLTRKLLFQFADDCVDLSDMLTELYRPESPMTTPGYFSIARFYVELRFTTMVTTAREKLPPLGIHSKIFNFIADALASRSTTVLSDEILCLATLLDLPVDQLQRMPKHQWHLAFWFLVEHIPAELVFSKGLKLQQPGFGWAPATFLDSHIAFTASPDATPSKLTEYGLEVKFPGFLLRGPSEMESSLAMVFSFKTEQTKWYHVTLIHVEEIGPWWKIFHVSELALIEQRPASLPNQRNVRGGIKATHMLSQVIRTHQNTLFVTTLGGVCLTEASAREAEFLNFVASRANGRTDLFNAHEILPDTLEASELDYVEYEDQLDEFVAMRAQYHGISGQRLDMQTWCVD